VLIQQPDYQTARNYWKVLKNRLNKEGSETVTKCNRLKMVAEDGKMRITDTADPETLHRHLGTWMTNVTWVKLLSVEMGYSKDDIRHT
jgi:DNA-damage-inducible protein D